MLLSADTNQGFLPMIRNLICAALLVSMSACASAAKRTETPPPATAPAASDAETVVRTFLAAYNRHDVPAMLELLDTGFVWLNLAGDSVQVETRGLDALKRALESYFRSLPTARSTLETIVASGIIPRFKSRNSR